MLLKILTKNEQQYHKISVFVQLSLH